MGTLSVTVHVEDREEGEIIDDENVFEDISDNSISDVDGPHTSGKSVLHRESLRTVSLSSVSDVDTLASSTHIQHHEHHHCRKSRRRKRSRSEKRNGYLKRRLSSCQSSDSENGLRSKKRLKEQLKEAVRIGTSEQSVTHNTLRDRLQGMVQSADCFHLSKECDQKTTIISPVEIESCHRARADSFKGIEIDRELQELRIEALKTAVLNKHIHRKKRNRGECEDSVMSDSSQKSDLENKENSGIINGLDVADQAIDVCKSAQVVCDNTTNSPTTDLPSPMEEDADALRALLLASMNNRTTDSKQNNDTPEEIKNKVIEIKTVDSSTGIQVDLKNAKVGPNKKVGNKVVSCINKNSQSLTKTVTSSKIVHKEGFSKSSLPKPSIMSNRNRLVNSKKNNLVQGTLITDVSMLPPVKPLIIKIDCDSDSDDDQIFFDKTLGTMKDDVNLKKPMGKELTHQSSEVDTCVPVEIQHSLDHLLKQERAKVEAESSKVTPQKNNFKPEMLSKSSLKLLSHEQQIEYRALIDKIKSKTWKKIDLGTVKQSNNIKRVTKTKVINTISKPSSILGGISINPVKETSLLSGQKTASLTPSVMPQVNNSSSNQGASKSKEQNNTIPAKFVHPGSNTKIPYTAPVNSNRKSLKLVNCANKQFKVHETSIRIVTKECNNKIGKGVSDSSNNQMTCSNSKTVCGGVKKQEVGRFRAAIQDMQIQHNGRLQIKVHYRPLSGLIRKINETNIERKKHELLVEKLVRELSEARKKVSQCIENRGCLVDELISKKDLIDRSTKQVVQPKVIAKQQTLRDDLKQSSASSMHSVNIIGAKPETDTVKKDESEHLETILTKELHIGVAKDVDVDAEQQRKNDENEEIQICSVVAMKNISTDVDAESENITKGTDEVTNIGMTSVGSYVSPLGNYTRFQAVDPLGILCPYEVSGSCRDPECKFTHFGVNSAKVT